MGMGHFSKNKAWSDHHPLLVGPAVDDDADGKVWYQCDMTVIALAPTPHDVT
jgi:hypothetical protein